jgi:hypothetical protein
VEQLTEPSEDPFWWRFKPGRSANPHGRGAPSVAAREEATRLTAQFLEVHGRAPSPSERTKIRNAAEFRVDAGRRALSPKDRVKCNNCAARLERSLGIDRIPRATRPPPQPEPPKEEPPAAPRRRTALEIANQLEAK